MTIRIVSQALFFTAAMGLGLSAALPASAIQIAIEATVDEFDPVFGNALSPLIGERLSIRLVFDDALLELPAIGESMTSGSVPLSFSFSGGGLSFEATSGSITVVNADNSAVDEFRVTLTDAGRDVGVRSVVLSWTGRNFDPGPVDFSRANRRRLNVNQVPAGGFEARIDSTNVVPEPGTALLLGVGLALLAGAPRGMRAFPEAYLQVNSDS